MKGRKCLSQSTIAVIPIAVLKFRTSNGNPKSDLASQDTCAIVWSSKRQSLICSLFWDDNILCFDREWRMEEPGHFHGNAKCFHQIHTGKQPFEIDQSCPFLRHVWEATVPSTREDTDTVRKKHHFCSRTVEFSFIDTKDLWQVNFASRPIMIKRGVVFPLPVCLRHCWVRYYHLEQWFPNNSKILVWWTPCKYFNISWPDKTKKKTLR